MVDQHCMFVTRLVLLHCFLDFLMSLNGFSQHFLSFLLAFIFDLVLNHFLLFYTDFRVHYLQWTKLSELRVLQNIERIGFNNINNLISSFLFPHSTLLLVNFNYCFASRNVYSYQLGNCFKLFSFVYYPINYFHSFVFIDLFVLASFIFYHFLAHFSTELKTVYKLIFSLKRYSQTKLCIQTAISTPMFLQKAILVKQQHFNK